MTTPVSKQTAITTIEDELVFIKGRNRKGFDTLNVALPNSFAHALQDHLNNSYNGGDYLIEARRMLQACAQIHTLTDCRIGNESSIRGQVESYLDSDASRLSYFLWWTDRIEAALNAPDPAEAKKTAKPAAGPAFGPHLPPSPFAWQTFPFPEPEPVIEPVMRQWKQDHPDEARELSALLVEWKKSLPKAFTEYAEASARIRSHDKGLEKSCATALQTIMGSHLDNMVSSALHCQRCELDSGQTPASVSVVDTRQSFIDLDAVNEHMPKLLELLYRMSHQIAPAAPAAPLKRYIGSRGPLPQNSSGSQASKPPEPPIENEEVKLLLGAFETAKKNLALIREQHAPPKPAGTLFPNNPVPSAQYHLLPRSTQIDGSSSILEMDMLNTACHPYLTANMKPETVRQIAEHLTALSHAVENASRDEEVQLGKAVDAFRKEFWAKIEMPYTALQACRVQGPTPP